MKTTLARLNERLQKIDTIIEVELQPKLDEVMARMAVSYQKGYAPSEVLLQRKKQLQQQISSLQSEWSNVSNLSSTLMSLVGHQETLELMRDVNGLLQEAQTAITPESAQELNEQHRECVRAMGLVQRQITTALQHSSTVRDMTSGSAGQVLFTEDDQADLDRWMAAQGAVRPSPPDRREPTAPITERRRELVDPLLSAVPRDAGSLVARVMQAERPGT